MSGTLYVVATPIGNLADITLRALEVLGRVACIAAEDTRHSRKLLAAHGITTPLVSYHRHRENEQAARLLQRLQAGEDVALVADAGTPGINDPGARLVQLAMANSVPVVPVPGPSALAAALSVAGFSGDTVHFAGFLPATPRARRSRLAELARLPGLVACFEAPHRLAASLADCGAAFGPAARLVLCRELTKVHEQILHTTVEEAMALVADGRIPCRGEFVLLLQAESTPAPTDAELARRLAELLPVMPLRQAVAEVSTVHGLPRRRVYQLALEMAKDFRNR